MKNATFYKNEMNKDHVDSKALRGDVIIKIDDRFFVIEMNMKNEFERNVEYTDRVYRYRSHYGEEIDYPEVLYIGFDNFYYKEDKKPIEVFYTQTDDGLCLVPKIHMLIFLPLLLKTWYDRSVDTELRDFCKTVLTMYETSKEKALEYARGDKLMEKYLEVSKNVQNEDYGLWRSYDHEQATLESYKIQFLEEGMEKGMKKGIEQGIQQNRLDNARAFIESGIDEKKVIEILKLTKEEIDLL